VVLLLSVREADKIKPLLTKTSSSCVELQYKLYYGTLAGVQQL
jgi:hypothetical protein